MKTTFYKIYTLFATLLLTGTIESYAQKDTLSSAIYMDREDELVNLPFRQVSKNEVVSAVGVLDVGKIGRYDNNIWINDATTGRIIGLMGANNIRGIGVGIDVASETGTGTQSGNTLYIVDGLPRDISTLRMSEVESISVLKDASAAVLYGTQAVNGVIMITTKRGFEGKSQAHVNFNYGLRSPIELPSYMNSVDYMTWYNQACAMMDSTLCTVTKKLSITAAAIHTGTHQRTTTATDGSESSRTITMLTQSSEAATKLPSTM